MIIHTVPSIADIATGPAYSVVRLAQELGRATSEPVQLYTVTMNDSLHATEKSLDGLTNREFPRSAGPRALGRSRALARALQSEARAGPGGALLHNHSLWMMANVYPGRVAKKARLPYICSPRGTLAPYAFRSGSAVKRLFWPVVQKPSLQAVNCFHATSRQEYEDIRGHGFTQPVAVIPIGIDVPVEYALSPGSDSGRRTLSYIGRIHPIKGLDRLLHAWVELSKRFEDWRLVIAGPGDPVYVESLRALQASLGTDRVDFVGPVYGTAKWELLVRSQLFVLPSHSENFAVAVAEALAAAVPVVATRGTPWGEMERVGCGRWVESAVEGLACGLAELMAMTPSALHEKGIKGRSWMISDFSWSVIAKETLAVYKWVRTGGAPPRSMIMD